MQKKSLVEITKIFLSEQTQKDFKDYVQDYRLEEENVIESNLRNEIKNKFNGELVLLKSEVDSLIRNNVKTIYESHTSNQTQYFGIENERLFKLLDTFYPNDFYPQVTITQLKYIPPQERMEEILTYALENNLDAKYLSYLIEILDNYDIINNPTNYTMVSSSEEEFNEGHVNDVEFIKDNYFYKMGAIFEAFLPPFEQVMEYILENHPEKFTDDIYTKSYKHKVDEKEYIIFVF